MKMKSLFLFLALVFTLSIHAQPYYLRGAQDPAGPCDWNNTHPDCEMINQGPGIYEVFATASNDRWKIYDAATGNFIPSGIGNALWIEPGVSGFFTFNSITGEIGVEDGQGYDICAPGQFNPVPWQNDTPMRRVDGINGSSYCIDVPVAGTYQWKPTFCGTWNTFDQNTLLRIAASENPPNWTVTTGNDLDVICVFYDRITGNLTSSTVTLPVELGEFKAQRMEDQVKVSWSTFTEINNDFFTLERSKNGIDFETLEIIEGAGNTAVKQIYSYMDADPYPGMNYYRLQQEDFDGKTTFSQIVSVEFYDDTPVFVHPNPAIDVLRISQKGERALNITITYMNGQIVWKQNNLNTDQINIQGLKEGMYTVSIQDQYQGQIYTDRFVKL